MSNKVAEKDKEDQLISKKFASAKKKKEIPLEDFKGIILLIVLYAIQGVPQFFFGRTIHVLFIENGAQTADLGTLTLTQMPYAIKFLFAPFIDTHYFQSFGRRKSYIIPMQYIFSGICFLLWWLINEEIKNLNVTAVLLFGFLSNAIMAIQDVAVDGWVLSILSEESLAYGSLAQTIGLTLGGIISFNMFIPLNSKNFCNEYLFSSPQEVPLLSVDTFWLWIGIFTFGVTALTHFLKKEKETPVETVTSTWEAIQSMKTFITNPNLRRLALIGVTGYLTLMPIYGLADTKLIQKNFPKETITNITTALIPINILASFLVSKLAKRKLEMKVKLWSYGVSYFLCLFYFWVVIRFDLGVNYESTFYYVLIGNIVATFVGCGHFVSNGAYWNRICDEATGATFLTALASLGNLSFLWPRSLSLYINHYVPWEYMGVFTIIATPLYFVWYRKQLLILHTKAAKDFAHVKTE